MILRICHGEDPFDRLRVNSATKRSPPAGPETASLALAVTGSHRDCTYTWNSRRQEACCSELFALVTVGVLVPIRPSLRAILLFLTAIVVLKPVQGFFLRRRWVKGPGLAAAGVALRSSLSGPGMEGQTMFPASSRACSQNVRLALLLRRLMDPFSTARRRRTAGFEPDVLTEQEVRELLTEVTEEQEAKARELSLTPLKEQTLVAGFPAGH